MDTIGRPNGLKQHICSRGTCSEQMLMALLALSLALGMATLLSLSRRFSRLIFHHNPLVLEHHNLRSRCQRLAVDQNRYLDLYGLKLGFILSLHLKLDLLATPDAICRIRV